MTQNYEYASICELVVLIRAQKVSPAEINPQELSPENTAFANYYGLPAISVPCGFDRYGLPLGLQIVGKPWDDATVIHLAYQYQIATDYGKHPVK